MIITARFKITLTFLVVILLLSKCQTENKETRQQPNIIVILADDLGVGDVHEHFPDNKISTPNFDKLAREGMSFMDAHSSSAVCSPSRYGLLTGRYNWRTPLQEWVLASYEPPLIEKGRTTLPDMLRQNGYSTACIGKWHLGWNWAGEHVSERIEERHGLNKYKWDYSKPITGGPTEHGFDYYFGTDLPNFPPFTFIENDHVFEMPTETYKYTENPSFVVLPRQFEGSPMAPGWKFEQILPELTNKVVQYIHNQSKSEKPFFLYFSMTSPHEPVAPQDKFAGKSKIAPIADFVMDTDWSVGEVLKAVEEAGISENTLIVFTADNGHSHYTGWNELVDAGHMPSGPYRGHKGDIWEGGHRVPFIVKWEGKVKPASVSNQVVCLTDIFSTCYKLVTGSLPPPNEGEDSFDFLDVLLKPDGKAQRKNLVSHSVNGEFGYRDKDGWKIAFTLPEKNLELSRGKQTMVELYNLATDSVEAHNVLDEYPEVAERLRHELETIVNRGTSREGQEQANDIQVRIDTIQMARWATK